MRALVKAEGRARPVAGWTYPSPSRPRGRADQGAPTGICGTDLHIHHWDDWAQRTVTVPLVVGHEFVGGSSRSAPTSTRSRVGDLVSGEGHIVCGHCRNCRAGRRHLCARHPGLGVNRAGRLRRVHRRCRPPTSGCTPPTSTSTSRAIFDPFGNAVHTALSFPTGRRGRPDHRRRPDRHAWPRPSSGTSGARHVVITDVNDYRLDLAGEMGADPCRQRRRPEPRATAMQKLGMTRGLRRRAGDVGQPRRLPRHARTT